MVDIDIAEMECGEDSLFEDSSAAKTDETVKPLKPINRNID